MKTWHRWAGPLTAVTLAWVSAGCSDDATGRAQAFVEPEDTIPEGLEPGDGEENIRDRWTVEYEKFLVTIGNFRAAQSSDASASVRNPALYVVDLKNTPAGGFIIADFADLEAVRWDKVGFDLANTPTDAQRATGLSDADYALMTQGNYSLFVQGRLTKADGQSCLPSAPADCAPATEVAFAWGIKAGTSFDDCASEDGDVGFTVPSGGTVQVKPTIHGDHWFFNNITQGEEVTARQAQWVADSDLNRDGEVTLDELRQVPAAELFTQAKGYSISGAVIPVATAYDFLEAQARTLGDYQGDGECPTRVVVP
ncbi:MAG TPA: hypothetical protein VEY30_12520 [Myxococcaceae bacterium]|nr:hypothetical protein [Myxococcaceae bacterium]